MSFTIAIDGPAGAGKSTIAKLVAKELECIYVDTGAMYRALALYMVRKGVDIHDEKKVEAELAGADVSLMYDKGELKVMLNGENVAGIIRTPEVSEAASVVSAYRQVRKELVRRQQLMAEKTDLVMDGRDIGTCVLPSADLKIYLTADARVRGERRYKELLEKGEECDLEEIIRDVIERDRRDMTREESPLRQADDAGLVDSSYMSIEEVCSAILDLVKDKKKTALR